MSARALELQSLRRELGVAKDLLAQLEARLVALEQEGFEFVDPLPGTPPEGPFSASPGSGGGYFSRGSTASASPGSGGVNLSQASHQRPLPPPTPSGRPGPAGVNSTLALDLSTDTCADGSSRLNPGAPTSQFRTAVAQEVGRFLRRAVDGGHLRSSGRNNLDLTSRYYVVLRDFEGRDFAEPCVFTTFGPCKALCCRGPDKGRSVFVGLPTQAEVAEALRTAGFSWPSEGLDVQSRRL